MHFVISSKIIDVYVNDFTCCITDVYFTHVASYFIIGTCRIVPIIHGINTEEADACTLLIVQSVRLPVHYHVITIPKHRKIKISINFFLLKVTTNDDF